MSFLIGSTLKELPQDIKGIILDLWEKLTGYNICYEKYKKYYCGLQLDDLSGSIIFSYAFPNDKWKGYYDMKYLTTEVDTYKYLHICEKCLRYYMITNAVQRRCLKCYWRE